MSAPRGAPRNGPGALARSVRPRRREAGELPARLAHLAPAVAAFRDGLVSDKGGPDACTVAELGLCDMAARLLTTILLLTYNVQARGAVTRKGEIRAPLTALAAYENALRHTLQALGLGRRMKDAQTLSGYLADVEARRQGDANGDGKVSGHEGGDDRPAETNVDGDA